MSLITATLFNIKPVLPQGTVRTVCQWMNDQNVNKGYTQALREAVERRAREKAEAYLAAMGDDELNAEELAKRLGVQMKSARVWLTNHEGKFVRRVKNLTHGRSTFVRIKEGGAA